MVQEKILRQHGIKWRQLKVTMVRSTPPSKLQVMHVAFPTVPQELCSCRQAHTEAAEGRWDATCFGQLLRLYLRTQDPIQSLATHCQHAHAHEGGACRHIWKSRRQNFPFSTALRE